MSAATAAARRLRRLWSKEDSEAAIAWLRATRREAIRTEIAHILPSEWAEKNRYLPEGTTPLPGPFSWDVIPYMREPCDNFAATSDVHETVIMKGTQLAGTVASIDNGIGYGIACEPGPMLFVSGDAGMAEAAIELRVDKMIQHSGLSGKIFAQVAKKANKKSGDTKRQKEFPGGFLLAIGPKSGSKLRQFPIRYLFFDELDAYPLQVGGGDKKAKTANEGDPITLAIRRTDSFEAIRKIIYCSTPLIKQTSRIFKLFLEGDQRKYFVPCKHCGHMQYLEWKNFHFEKDDEGRLLYEYDKDGKPIEGSGHVWYECEACHGTWRNHDKTLFLRDAKAGGFDLPDGRHVHAEWRSTAKARRPGLRSYHIPAFLSPVGFRSWESIAQEWIEAKGDQGRLRAIVNTVFGEPYEERGNAPDYQRVMLRREDYAPEALILKEGDTHDWLEAILPKRPLVLTLGADVQHDRIECELVAFGSGMESWSAGYHIFEGDTSDLASPAWTMLTEVLERTRSGPNLSLSLIDSSDGSMTSTVYAFCDRFASKVLPVKGGYRQGVKAFALRDCPGYLRKRVDLDESFMKAEFYRLVANGPADRPAEGQPLPEGYCHLPQEYDRRHFEKLFAEDQELILDRNTGRGHWEWKKRGRNEALDCRAYAMGALYVFASLITADTDDKTGTVDWPLFWKYIAATASRS